MFFLYISVFLWHQGCSGMSAHPPSTFVCTHPNHTWKKFINVNSNVKSKNPCIGQLLVILNLIIHYLKYLVMTSCKMEIYLTNSQKSKSVGSLFISASLYQQICGGPTQLWLMANTLFWTTVRDLPIPFFILFYIIFYITSNICLLM